jgi:hypothetical protein
MSFLDKIFCASPNCENECGRKMSEDEKIRLVYLGESLVAYAYFCGEPENKFRNSELAPDIAAT